MRLLWSGFGLGEHDPIVPGMEFAGFRENKVGGLVLAWRSFVPAVSGGSIHALSLEYQVEVTRELTTEATSLSDSRSIDLTLSGEQGLYARGLEVTASVWTAVHAHCPATPLQLGEIKQPGFDSPPPKTGRNSTN